MKKQLYLILSLMTMFFLLTGCQTSETSKAKQNAPMKIVEHIDGSKVEVPLNPERLAAVYGPSYEALAVLGVEEKIVVCSDVQVENFPWARKVFKCMKKLPYLHNVHSSVNVEELKTYQPDLAFTFNRPNELKQMQAFDIGAIYGRTTTTLDDTKKQLMAYANCLDDENAVARANEYAEYFDAKLAKIKAKTDLIPEEKRPKVYYAGIDILTTYGKYSDLGEVIDAAGGVSVTKDLEAGNHSQINFEQLAQYNPDFIFIDHGSMNDKASVEEILSGTYKNTQYQSIKAVADKNVYLTPSGVFYWDMGLQKILLVMHMAKILHPEEFADLNMVAEVQEFYEKFFAHDLTDKEAEQILAREDA